MTFAYKIWVKKNNNKSGLYLIEKNQTSWKHILLYSTKGLKKMLAKIFKRNKKIIKFSSNLV